MPSRLQCAAGRRVIDYRVIPALQREFSQPDILTEEQYRQLLSVIPVHEPHGARDIAQISLLHDTGVRLGELVSLNLDDVDVHTKHVATNGAVLYRGVLRTEKVRSRPPHRQIYWLDEANRHLANWLNVREILAKRYSQRKFDPDSRSMGLRPHRNGVGVALDKYAVAAGIAENIHAHMFRHAFARSRVLGGADTSAIASLLGHSSIESSVVYTRLYGKQLQEAYVRFMPEPEP